LARFSLLQCTRILYEGVRFARLRISPTPPNITQIELSVWVFFL